MAIGILALAGGMMLVAGCTAGSGQLRNNREEGPMTGLFSGDEGGFVLYQKREQPAPEQSSENK